MKLSFSDENYCLGSIRPLKLIVSHKADTYVFNFNQSKAKILNLRKFFLVTLMRHKMNQINNPSSYIFSSN